MPSIGWRKSYKYFQKVVIKKDFLKLIPLHFPIRINRGHLRTPKVGITICIIIWLSAALLSSPYPIFANTKYYNKSGSCNCKVDWPQNSTFIFEVMHGTLQMTCGFLIPTAIIIISYILLLQRIRRMARVKLTSTFHAPNRKMTRMVIVVVLAFITLHAPHYIMEIVQITKKVEDADTQRRSARWQVLVFVYWNLISQMSLYINSALNPVLYFLLNENFSEYFILIINTNLLFFIFIPFLFNF